MPKGSTKKSPKKISILDPVSTVEAPQGRGEKTRAAIVQAALRLFAKKGFNQTSVQEIADACGITQPAIFIHFKAKVDLLDAVRKFVSKSNHEYIDQKVDDRNNAFEALNWHCVGNLEWGIHHPDEAQIIVLTYYYSFFDPHFAKIFPGVVGLGTERILKYVLAGVREKIFSLTLPESEVAAMIHEYLLGCFFRNLPARSSRTLTRAEFERLQFFLARILKT